MASLSASYRDSTGIRLKVEGCSRKYWESIFIHIQNSLGLHSSDLLCLLLLTIIEFMIIHAITLCSWPHQRHTLVDYDRLCQGLWIIAAYQWQSHGVKMEFHSQDQCINITSINYFFQGWAGWDMLSGFVALMTTAKRAVMTRTAIALPAKSCNTLD